jgi:HAMP domain-containing protein
MQVTLTQQNMLDRVFGWWHAIAAPPPVPEDAPLHEREFMRKARFTSIILLIEIIESLSVLGQPPYGPQLYIPLSISLFMLIVGVILNRFGKVRAAGILIWATINLGMCSFLLSLGLTGSGLDPYAMRQFAILVHPDLIAISLFPAPVASAIGIVNCLLTIGLITFLPKTSELLHLYSISSYSVYYIPLYVQTVTIVMCLLWVNSNSQEMKRANRAEEVNKLSQALSAQQQIEMQKSQQLEKDIQRIVSVHAQVANGHYDARVPVDQIGHNNVLWSIAGSLNTLLARLQRRYEEAQQLRRTEQAIYQTLQHIQLAKKQGMPLHLQRTGTSLDTLLTEMLGDIPSLR